MPTDMYVQLGDVKGEATDDKHKDWIEVFSWSIGVSQPASPIASAGAGGTTGKADISDFTFTHPLDLSSAKLFELCCTGEHVKKIVFEQQKASGKEKIVFLKMTLENAIISSIQPSGGAGGEPMESVSLRFSKIEYDYKQQKDDGSTGGNMSAKWNLKENKAA